MTAPSYVHTLSVLAVGEWRPHLQHLFPRRYRSALRTLAVLAKARVVATTVDVRARPPARYPQACLQLMPEEILQYMFTFVTAAPVPDGWTRE